MMIQFVLPLLTFVLEPATLTPTASPVPRPAPVAQEASVEVGRDSSKRFAFDWDGKDEVGIDYTVPIQDVEFQYTPVAGGQARLVKVALPVQAGENQVPVKDALVGIPAGEYDATVRLVDVSGQMSGFSPVLSVRVRVKNPSRPANVRVVGP